MPLEPHPSVTNLIQAATATARHSGGSPAPPTTDQSGRQGRATESGTSAVGWIHRATRSGSFIRRASFSMPVKIRNCMPYLTLTKALGSAWQRLRPRLRAAAPIARRQFHRRVGRDPLDLARPCGRDDGQVVTISSDPDGCADPLTVAAKRRQQHERLVTEVQESSGCHDRTVGDVTRGVRQELWHTSLSPEIALVWSSVGVAGAGGPGDSACVVICGGGMGCDASATIPSGVSAEPSRAPADDFQTTRRTTYVLSGDMPPLRQGDLVRLWSARSAGHGRRPEGAAVLLPAARAGWPVQEALRSRLIPRCHTHQVCRPLTLSGRHTPCGVPPRQHALPLTVP